MITRKMVTNCKHCQKKMLTNNPQKKYCNQKCQFKWQYKNNPKFKNRVNQNSKKSYDKRKNNPEFKKRNAERVKKWISNNKEKFNQKMLENWKKRYQERKFNHQCTKCKKTEQKKTLCTECYNKKQQYLKKQKVIQ